MKKLSKLIKNNYYIKENINNFHYIFIKNKNKRRYYFLQYIL